MTFYACTALQNAAVLQSFSDFYVWFAVRVNETDTFADEEGLNDEYFDFEDISGMASLYVVLFSSSSMTSSVFSCCVLLQRFRQPVTLLSRLELQMLCYYCLLCVSSSFCSVCTIFLTTLHDLDNSWKRYDPDAI